MAPLAKVGVVDVLTDDGLAVVVTLVLANDVTILTVVVLDENAATLAAVFVVA